MKRSVLKTTFSWPALALAAVALLAFHSAEIRLDGANWPGWRGPDGTGVSSETGLPTAWSDTENILWKTPIEGRGHSSPIVWGDRIFLTTAIEGEVVPGAGAPVHSIQGQVFKHPDSVGSEHAHTLKVLAIDADIGEVLWSKIAYEGTVYDDRHRRASYASNTAVTDGSRVYSYFGSQGLYAHDFDGNLIWDRDLGDLPEFGVGSGTSPVLYRDLLIIQFDRGEGEDSFIVALNKKTGEEVWRKDRKVEASWSTPLVVEDSNGRAQLITNGNQALITYDPESGEELWRAEGLQSNAIHSPLVGHGMVYLTAGFPRKISVAIRLEEAGEKWGMRDAVTSMRTAWEYNKGTAYVPSNILYGDYIYLMSDKGILTCLDAKTGAVVYEGGRVPVPATFLSSPIAFDGKILISSLDGDSFLIKAGPEHEVLATNSINEPIYATPAISNGRIYIRGERHLFAIGR